MNSRCIALAFTCMIMVWPAEKAAAAGETQSYQVASILSAVPMPRSRASKSEVSYQLAALPQEQADDPYTGQPETPPQYTPQLPKFRADPDHFRLLVAPIDIRVTAPPAGTVVRNWGRKAPRKPDNYAAQSFCMAKAIYYEARGEPLAGRLAVGRVILNRVNSRFYPGTVCDVVYQNAHWRNRCQFSFACDGKPDIPRHMRSWNDAVTLAEQLLCRSGQACRPMIVGGRINISTHYHATYVKPRWSKKMPRTGRIGQHIFYFTASR